jgi:LacI family transcriptional regulator
MRPTVNDIAREAGVSLATVDRVLNARPGVRLRTIAAVNEAVARLGYVRDIAAANLARGRSYRLAFCIPDGDGQFIGTLLAAIAEASQQPAATRTEVILRRMPAEDPHALAALLADLAAAGIDGVAVMAPETPVVRDAVRAMKARGIAVAALVSDLPNSGVDHFVGIDNRAAGRTAGRLMGRFLGAGPRRRSVAVLADSMQARDAIERRLGFDEVMLASFPQIEPLPTFETHGRRDLLVRVLAEGLAAHPDIGGIYLVGSGLRGLVAELLARDLAGRLVVIGHELTPAARAALLAGHLDAVIAQDAGHLIRSALRVLRARIDGAGIIASQELIRIEIVMAENLPGA